MFAAVALVASVTAAAVLAAARPRASVAAASCAKGSLALVHSGQLTSRPTRRRTRRTSRTTSPPTARASRAPSPTRSPGSSASARAQVKWTVEPFDSSYAPGPKSFDFDINEISITGARAKAVTSRRPTTPIRRRSSSSRARKYQHATTLAPLRGAKFGVPGWDDEPRGRHGRRSTRRRSPTSTTAPTTWSAGVAREWRRRDRRRSRDGVLPDLRRDPARRRRRPVQRTRWRQLGRAAVEALEADGQCVDQALGQAALERDARLDHQAAGCSRAPACPC